MTVELRDLYQQVILDHQKSPRNFRAMADADRTAHGHNPLCGDNVSVYLKLDQGVVTDVSFHGVGCAICTSSASMMTARVKGMAADQVEKLFQSFHHLVTDDAGKEDGGDELGKLRVFAGVREFPIRVKCATLPWHTLRAALRGSEEDVSTE
jgi:nitrogen fixation NifU-like protein